MLATLRLWPLLGLSLTYAATINVIPATDTRLVYSPGWTQNVSQSTQDSFMQAEGVGCSVSVTLPINASSVTYVGFKRAGGSMYGYTLDCEEDCLLQTANGSDPTVTDDASVPQSTLFTLDLDPSTQHTLYVYNIPSDASDGFSQINLHNLNVALIDVTTGTGGGQPTPSNIGNTESTSESTSSTTASASTSLQLAQTSTSTTPTTLSSSASATPSSSNGVSTTPTNVGASSSSATQPGSTGTGSPTTSSPVRPVISSSSTAESGSGSGAETAGSSSGSTAGSSGGSGKTHGLSKSVAIGVSVLAVVFGGGIIAALFVFIRQRQQKHRNSYPGSSSGPQPPLSATGSIIPIMPPPDMRAASVTYNPAIPNPFIDPSDEPPQLDIPFNSSLMQRRMEGRTSPGSPASPAPTIPLPDIPRGATDSRSDSPVSAYARSDLWITRSPARSFAVL